MNQNAYSGQNVNAQSRDRQQKATAWQSRGSATSAWLVLAKESGRSGKPQKPTVASRQQTRWSDAGRGRAPSTLSCGLVVETNRADPAPNQSCVDSRSPWTKDRGPRKYASTRALVPHAMTPKSCSLCYRSQTTLSFLQLRLNFTECTKYPYGGAWSSGSGLPSAPDVSGQQGRGVGLRHAPASVSRTRTTSLASA